MKKYLKHSVSKIMGLNKRALKAEEIQIQVILGSGLFDESFYRNSYPDLKNNPALINKNELLKHFFVNGCEEGRLPCYLFDPLWYANEYKDVADSGINALYHYIAHGEKEGRNPSPYFDVSFYSSQVETLDEGQTYLTHFVYKGCREGLSPLQYFNTREYLEFNPDVLDSGQDPYYHFLSKGADEARHPMKGLDLKIYVEKFCEDKSIPLKEAFLKYSKEETADFDVLRDILCSKEGVVLRNNEDKLYHAPGGDFQELKYDLTEVELKQKVVAYYLPQFYPFKENDEWWGAGFTEWRNVVKGRSRFKGHYQPHLPRDLGYYDLRNTDTIASQIELAKKAGLFGFCFYYYWFNRKRLLDKPVEKFLSDQSLDMPFCIMWANENWTRTWDGFDNDVLIQQDYDEKDDQAFIEDLARHFSDSRYIHIDGRPIFFIYRPGIIPEAKERIAVWRKMLSEQYGIDALFFMAQGFGDTDPRVYGLDGAVEFPPHKVAQGLNLANPELELVDDEFEGLYFKYDDMVTNSLSEAKPEFDLIKCITPSWDNEARKPNKGMGFIGASPKKYKQWLARTLKYSSANPIENESFVFVNAWNEWAEGAHLEPDIYYGSAYLNATAEALLNIGDTPIQNKVVYVSHDAHKHGAQILSLNIVRQLKAFGVDVEVILINGGELLEDFKKEVKTYVVNGEKDIFCAVLNSIKGAQYAITNTTVTGEYTEILANSGYKIVSLIHELATLIKEYELEGAARKIAEFSDEIVFPATPVKASFEKIVGDMAEKARVIPQGIYQQLPEVIDPKKTLRERLNLDKNSKIIINAGFADLRKGFDLFVAIAKQLGKTQSDYHFVWLGGVQPELGCWLDKEIGKCKNIHIVPFTHEVSLYLRGADLFALTSREDPFPSVMLEALACGLPVVGFESGGGCVDILQNDLYGRLATYGDTAHFSSLVEEVIGGENEAKTKLRSKETGANYCWKDYVFRLLQLLNPELKKVSVVVPSYNYEEYMIERLSSIFNQTYPIYEVIILDDRSTDNSVDVIHSYLKSVGKKARVIVNEVNTGNVFKQWKQGVDLAAGDYIWIAEADDSAEPTLLEEAFKLNQEFDMACVDSRQVDEEGRPLADSYDYYYDDKMKQYMSGNNVTSGFGFLGDCMTVKNQLMNVSAIVFNKLTLTRHIERVIDDLVEYNVAGDWRLYVEMLSEPDSSIQVIGKSLNVHRRHASSVTRKNYGQVQLNEIMDVQNRALKLVGIPGLIEKQKEYLSDLENTFELHK